MIVLFVNRMKIERALVAINPGSVAASGSKEHRAPVTQDPAGNIYRLYLEAAEMGNG